MQRLGLSWCPPGCPAPDWGSGMANLPGPALRDLLRELLLLCPGMGKHMPSSKHPAYCGSAQLQFYIQTWVFEPSGFYCHSTKCQALKIRSEPN